MGQLIVIEGTDSSGKNTQSKLLVEYLKSKSKLTKLFSFPVYDSPTGNIISRYLGRGMQPEFGPSNSIDPKIASTWYATNRYEFKQALEAYLNSGTIVVCDRYVSSNQAHQGGKISPAERNQFFQWCDHLEYGTMGLPYPDKTIFLFVPWQVSMKLAAARGAVDGHESCLEHIQNAQDTYIQLAEKYKWITIDCSRGDSLRPIQDIQNEIQLALKIV